MFPASANLLGCNIAGCLLGDDRFEDQPQPVGFDHIPGGHFPDAHTTIGDAFRQSGRDQQVQRLADRGHADAQLRGDIVLPEPVTGLVCAGDDLFMQNVENILFKRTFLDDFAFLGAGGD